MRRLGAAPAERPSLRGDLILWDTDDSAITKVGCEPPATTRSDLTRRPGAFPVRALSPPMRGISLVPQVGDNRGMLTALSLALVVVLTVAIVLLSPKRDR
jgi:hypothetical protein